MTYFDPMPPDASPAHPLEAELRRQIHGGTYPSPRRVRAYLRAVGLGVPCRIAAIRFGVRGTPPTFRGKACGPHHLILVHPGLGYLCFHGPFEPFMRALKRRHLVFGEPRACESAARFIPTIRDAILAMRRRELAPLMRKRGEDVTFAAEVQARNLALQRVRDRVSGARGALNEWLEIVLVRHQGELNQIRRKLVEFLGLLMRDCDRGIDAAYSFFTILEQIYQTFDLTELARRFPVLVAEIIPRLHGGKSEALAAMAAEAGERQYNSTVQQALTFLRQRYADPVSLADVAAAVHVSASYLSRLFRRETGRTLTEVLQALRIAHAKRMLAGGDRGTLPIALACGFQTPEHFFRTFRKLVGVTPRAYRLAQRV